MSHEDYWKEAVTSSLDELHIKLTEHEIVSIAKDMQNAHENIGMCFGHVENPLIDQMRRQEDKHKSEMKREVGRLEELLEVCKKNVAIRRHCDVEDVTISKDGVFYK